MDESFRGFNGVYSDDFGGGAVQGVYAGDKNGRFDGQQYEYGF